MLDVKPFQETLHAGMCGPASLKIVLDHYNCVKSERELAEHMGVTKDICANDTSIVAQAQALGFKVEVKNESTFGDIGAWLKRGVPVIVNWFTRGRSDYSDSEVPEGHYSVAVGLDDEYIYLQDPEIGGVRKISRDNFMKVWFDFTGEHISPNELIIRQTIAVYERAAGISGQAAAPTNGVQRIAPVARAVEAMKP